ncbi:hypothetical protein DPMN_149134 [Dreissena polymorpha]|uniref:Uncharacterized protein n=1 Tax=Dreissena polymorpha TaxID=45954 RepID=A0A9D4FB70_DREPO|nr:hypothetical protein DPMN_149134 [Dreissena polymorpha]
MHPESQTGSGNRHCDRAVMANSDMVPTVDGNSGGYTNYNLERNKLLQRPYQDTEHPLWKQLKLIVYKVSGKVLKKTRNSLPTYLCVPET